MTAPATLALTVSTPTAVVIEVEGVRQVRAEDASGSFGILPGHTGFLTALAVSVLSWRDDQGGEHYVALRGGMLQVSGGRQVAVASREAVPGDDLERLEREVLAGFHRREEEERAARTDTYRLYLEAIKQIYRCLRPDRACGPGFGKDGFGEGGFGEGGGG